MHKCLICGDDTGNEATFGDTVIHVCIKRTCRGIFAFKVLGSFPIAWLCPEDVFDDNHISREVYEYYEKHPDKFVGIAHYNGDDMWNYGFGDLFHDATESTGEQMQEDYVTNTSFKQLPLIINHLTSDRAKELYKKRFEKGE